ncbi:MAG: RagB/SusD family nutrient uptake outer membrane protein [Muribaculaceae bacterium]|nr:RagB/SusD family nutrient uptake outer membrane protein [Muribaculaceae bacterium]MDE6343449.1 RagB/SusD family nutrient uptake outer membrane protein [Muribaculaceae bacterium]MDE6609468.1 RagB/SusD family nutrient uptake outer membrane protein [Muribaculaceae bacterium]
MKIKNMLMSAAMIGALASCNMDEIYYSQVVPDNFVENENNIYQLLSRPFYHWKVFCAEHVFSINEFMADAMINPSRTSGDWYDNGAYIQLHDHTMNWEHSRADTNWKEAMQGVARCLTVIEQINSLDYSAMNLTEEDRASHLGQMQAMIGYFYMKTMDWYGGAPIYQSTNDPLKPRATAKETFDYTEELLKEAVAGLPARQTVNQDIDGYISKGAAAMLLAELYFNAESYIGVQMFDEAEQICQDIINGVYGPYELEDTWHGSFDFENKSSTEIIWGVPADYTQMKNDWWTNFFPYRISLYFGINTGFPGSCNNGWCLAPSRNPEGKLYMETNPEIKLGSPYEKFDDGDLRKKKYRYLGNGEYEGMFLIGDLQDDRYPERVCTGNRSWLNGKMISITDAVAPYSKLKSADNPNGEYNSVADLPSEMYYCAEENAGVRLVKYPIPDENEYRLYGTASQPVLRLTEVYYTLAECKFRKGDKQGAADLINKVRARNFVGGADPNPVTASNLDQWRLLDEWMIEFLGEGRRRIDLIRWGVFHTENWWSHTATNDKNVCRLPVGDSVIGSNNLLKQNPGYGGDELTPDEI